MNKNLLSGIVAAMFLLSACASVMVSTSTPASQTTANSTYELKLEPLKKGKNYYSLFLLTVVNKTKRPIKIDWNRTRYIHNGNYRNGFVFKGVSPEEIKTATIPPDVVQASQTFVREIAPAKLVALAPIRDRNLKAGESGFSPGVLPDGENGIQLVVTQDGRTVEERVTVAIKSGEVK